MKNKKNIEKYEKHIGNENNEIRTLIKIFVGVVIFFVLAYVLMGVITGEIKFKQQKQEVVIQYKEILAERTFKQKDKDYFVVFYNFGEEDAFLNVLLQEASYTGSVYEVDLDKKFNSTYIGEVNTKPASLKDLKVKSPTLIRITNGKAQKVVTGVSSIKNYISNLK